MADKKPLVLYSGGIQEIRSGDLIPLANIPPILTGKDADTVDGYHHNQSLLTTASPTFTGLTLSGLTNGSVLFAGLGGVISQNNANLFWDNTNNRLGIGIASPSQRLTVAGNIGLQAGANAFIGTLDNYALSLRTGGSDRVFINSSGNVGIGTTAPSERLEVSGTAKARFFKISDDYYTLSDLVSGGNLGLAGIGKVVNTLRGRPLVSVEYWDGSAWQSWTNSTAANMLDGDYTTDFVFDYTHRKWRIVVDGMSWKRTFALGINKIYTLAFNRSYSIMLETSSDGSTWTLRKDWGRLTMRECSYQDVLFGIDEWGDRYWRITVEYPTLVSGEVVRWSELAAYSYDPWFRPDVLQPYGANDARFRGNVYIPSGNVGIGTTVPGARLDVPTISGNIAGFGNLLINDQWASDVTFDGRTYNYKQAIYVRGTGGACKMVYNSETNRAGWVCDGPIMSMEDGAYFAGNVGIGTTAPSQRLHVVGNIGLQAGADVFVGTLDNYGLGLRTNNADRIFITNTGNVGIGTTAPGARLDILDGASTINLVKNGGFILGLSNWSLHVNTSGGANAVSSVDTSTYVFPPQSAKISVTTGGSSISDVQFYGGIYDASEVLVQGRYYTLSFWMKASSNISRHVRIMLNSSPWTVYTSILADLTTSWKRFVIGFQYTGVTSNILRINFYLGYNNSIDYWIDGVMLTKGSMAAEYTSLTLRDNGDMFISGNVGIGTMVPGAKLQVLGTETLGGIPNSSRIIIGGNGGDAMLHLMETTNGWNIRHKASDNTLRFSDILAGTDWVTFTETGNVGIGTTAPNYRCHVNGTFGFAPGNSVTPVNNGDVVIEATNNTTLTFKLKGSDGVVRTGTITLF